MSEWKEDIFDNFIKLKRGYDLPESSIVSGKYPIVASTTIKAYHNQFKVNPPGVVTGRSGSLGTVQYISTKYWPLNTTLYVKDFKGNFPKYVYYFLKKIHLENFNSGAGVPTLNQNHLHKLKIKIALLPIQKKIAAILSAYDDLIEKNNRRIAILEKMAEEIYREWFVRLRFPGHEQVKFNKGIPEGWEVKQIQNVCKIARGSSPRPINDSKYFVNGTIPWIKIADATASKMFVYETKEYVNDVGASFSRKLPRGSLIIATSGTLGFCIFLGIEGCVHDGWMYLTEYKKNVKPCFLYYVINYYREHLNNLSYGAAIQNINTEIIRRLPLILPTNEVLIKFYSVIEPIHKKIYNLGKVNNILKQTRDRLLTRLISGKLSVEDLDIQFPPSMREELE
ncbi:restriction endonuclease subunit S [Cuspidothrix issatschenkoi LEGE 03284]|uniref:restriction endonuclease subunit S n=1 Tax=Cuspidothrix issatschenkoi TaxID=230752 RepID=UPI001882D3AD|nr:restriction endonuclease subunit S [Cuspidothrix issatschenkoi]MBE9233247.1 restriction endonuclease subunit S [Cuspidothrix issatschenkoi LEGE 03284]